MAIQTMILDPAAQALTDDQIIGKINTATTQITRAGSVAAAARPIQDAEVTAENVAPGVAKVNLDGMSDTARGYVKTDPGEGQFKIIALAKTADGKLEVKFDDGV